MSSCPLNFHPGPEYHTGNRFWQGCPTILRTPRGRLFAGWYSGGTGEPDPDNYCLLVRSEDDGLNWSEPELVIPSEPANTSRCSAPVPVFSCAACSRDASC